jgi:hypothetical protein
MNHKIKNFLTFGLYDRLVKAECDVINLKSKLSSIDSTILEEIDGRGVLTEDSFSASDYDLVTHQDYDFDSFVTGDECVGEQDVERLIREHVEDYVYDVDKKFEDYYNATEIDEMVRDAVAASQLKFIKDTIKETCTEMLVDWCTRTAEAANKNKE